MHALYTTEKPFDLITLILLLRSREYEAYFAGLNFFRPYINPSLLGLNIQLSRLF
jgi:hypothetical protein